MQQRDQLSPSNPVRPQVGTSLFKIVHSTKGLLQLRPGATRGPQAPQTPLNILTYPASRMIMVQFIVRNSVD